MDSDTAGRGEEGQGWVIAQGGGWRSEAGMIRQAGVPLGKAQLSSPEARPCPL